MKNPHREKRSLDYHTGCVATKRKQRRFAPDMPVKSLAVFRIVSPKPLLQLVFYLVLFSTAAVPGAVEERAKLIGPKYRKGLRRKRKLRTIQL